MKLILKKKNNSTWTLNKSISNDYKSWEPLHVPKTSSSYLLAVNRKSLEI